MGVVHNCKTSEKTDSELIMQCDMGSADIIIVKKIIQMLNKIPGILKVIIT